MGVGRGGMLDELQGGRHVASDVHWVVTDPERRLGRRRSGHTERQPATLLVSSKLCEC